MKNTIIALLSLLVLITEGYNQKIFAQNLKFEMSSPFEVFRSRGARKIPLEFFLEKATKSCTIDYKINPSKQSAYPGRDYELVNGSIILDASNQYSGQIFITIKPNEYQERLKLIIEFDYINEKGEKKEQEFVILINPQNYASAINVEAPGIEFFTGGALDFFNKVKFQNIGGELVFNANGVLDKSRRWGGFIGISNFHNFTKDASNINRETQIIQIDTGRYIPGRTRYSEGNYIYHRKVATNQWSYYVNPTYRLNSETNEIFNIYSSIRLEALVVSTTTGYDIDTISLDTLTTALVNPNFQKNPITRIQNRTTTQTSGYFSVGTPMFIKIKDKFKLYFDPNLGGAINKKIKYVRGKDSPEIISEIKSEFRPFYLFRMRASEEFSGLHITIGGEIRGLFDSYVPVINAYLGIRANLAALFGK